MQKRLIPLKTNSHLRIAFQGYPHPAPVNSDITKDKPAPAKSPSLEDMKDASRGFQEEEDAKVLQV